MIQLRIHDESELYNTYDPAQTMISDSVYHYLKSYCTDLESEKHLHDTLQVISDGPVNAGRFRQAVRLAVQRDMDEFDRQIAVNRRRAVYGYIFGILFSIAGITLSIFLNQILLALISFFGSMAIRDAVTIQTKLIPDIKHLKKLMDPFLDFNLEVICKGSGGQDLQK